MQGSILELRNTHEGLRRLAGPRGRR